MCDSSKEPHCLTDHKSEDWIISTKPVLKRLLLFFEWVNAVLLRYFTLTHERRPWVVFLSLLEGDLKWFCDNLTSRFKTKTWKLAHPNTDLLDRYVGILYWKIWYFFTGYRWKPYINSIDFGAYCRKMFSDQHMWIISLYYIEKLVRKPQDKGKLYISVQSRQLIKLKWNGL